MSRITGYGRGWQEEKATTRFTRLRQIMREPASHRAWLIAYVAFCAVLATIFAVVTA